MNRPRGRPPRGSAAPTPEEVLAAALELLNEEGAEAFTMRSLAGRLNVNPMTIYYHFGDRDGLIAALSERVYLDVAAPESGEPRARMEALLRSYYAQVLRHPGLTLLIFSRPEVFPEQARRISDDIASLLHDAGISAARSRLWLHILVDFTHGAALATAIGGRSMPRGGGADGGYEEALAELLRGLGGSC